VHIWRGLYEPQLGFVEVRKQLITKVHFVFSELINSSLVWNDTTDDAMLHIRGNQGTYPFDMITDFELRHTATPTKAKGAAFYAQSGI
jgi:hypothetical protein